MKIAIALHRTAKPCDRRKHPRVSAGLPHVRRPSRQTKQRLQRKRASATELRHCRSHGTIKATRPSDWDCDGFSQSSAPAHSPSAKKSPACATKPIRNGTHSPLATPYAPCFPPPRNEQGLPHLPIDQSQRFPRVTIWHAFNPPPTPSAATSVPTPAQHE